MKHIRKTMALLFALVLCLGMLPATALAEGRDAVLAEKAVRTDHPQLPEPVCDPVLTFSSSEPFTLETVNHQKNWNETGTLEYSTDAQTWMTWDGAETLHSGLYCGRQRLFLRGTGNDRITNGYGWVLTGSNIRCSGNIEYLLDYRTVLEGEHPPMGSFCFAYLFRDCTALISAPRLPAETLATSCYALMFSGCTSLTTAPALPAKVLAEGCYLSMFSRCTALRAAPALPAMTMTSHCYSSMFWGCTNLMEAPALPATTLAVCCYNQMFQNCPALRVAPALNAKVTAAACYSYMFKGCTHLTSAPALPSTCLTSGCYSYMFKDCKFLSTIPALPATNLPDSCYKEMFAGCTRIKLSTEETNTYSTPYRIPIFGNAGNVAENALDDMFTGSGGTFTGTPDANTTYYLHNTNSIVW